MSDDKIQDEVGPIAPDEPVIHEPVIKPMNYKAVEYLNWFMTDAQNLRNWTIQMFNSDVDLTSPRLAELKAAAENSLSEIEDDVVKIKEFLKEYTLLKTDV